MFCEVEPKRRALQEANDELASAHRKLAAVEAKVRFIGDVNVVSEMIIFILQMA